MGLIQNAAMMRAAHAPSFILGYVMGLQVTRLTRKVATNETAKRYRQTPRGLEQQRVKQEKKQALSRKTATLHFSRWDELEEALLLEKAETMTYGQLAKEFGRTHYAIETRLRRLRGTEKSSHATL